MLLVTGQVVTVTYVTTVVPAPCPDGEPAGVDGAGVVPTGELPVGVPGVPGVPPGPVEDGVRIAGLDDTGATDEGGVPSAVSVSVWVTGHTVVYAGTVDVTTVVESAGQLTTVGAQLVMVTSLVVYTVEVVI